MKTNRPKQEKYIGVTLAIICFFVQIFPAIGREIDAEYDIELQRTLQYLGEKKFTVAKEKLEKLQRDYEKLDYRFYAIQGEVFLKLEKIDEAIGAFETSTKLRVDQPAVARKLYKLYLNSRKLQKAFDFIRLYLAQVPEDRLARFESLILSSRLGEKKYFQFALSKIGDNSRELEKKFPEIEKLIQKKEFQVAREICGSLILKNPTNPKLHSLLRITQNSIDPKSEEMEKVLLSSAAIFYQEKKYSLLLGNFYKLQKKKFQALNLYRRMFSQSLKKERYDFDEEVLYLLRDSYYEMDRTKDALAISELIQMSRRGDHQIEEELFHAYKVSGNREVLVYLIFHLTNAKENQNLEEYKQLLLEHDRKNADSEFMDIFPVFEFAE